VLLALFVVSMSLVLLALFVRAVVPMSSVLLALFVVSMSLVLLALFVRCCFNELGAPRTVCARCCCNELGVCTNRFLCADGSAIYFRLERDLSNMSPSKVRVIASTFPVERKVMPCDVCWPLALSLLYLVSLSLSLSLSLSQHSSTSP
jgi:hypothetical protein